MLVPLVFQEALGVAIKPIPIIRVFLGKSILIKWNRLTVFWRVKSPVGPKTMKVKPVFGQAVEPAAHFIADGSWPAKSNNVVLV